MQNHNQNKYLTIGIVLAAGMGKRMNSSLPKVAHVLYGKPLVIWAIESLLQAGVSKIVVVISPDQKIVEELIKNYKFHTEVEIHFAYQEKPFGTGHAALCGLKVVEQKLKHVLESSFNSQILIAYGDTPAVSGKTFQDFLKFHIKNQNSFTILAFKTNNPFGYGRIVTAESSEFLSIREEKDCSEQEKNINLCNSGLLCANFIDISNALPLLKNDNSAKEYYLTDAPLISKKNGGKVGYLVGQDETEFLGINSQEQLAEMEKKFKEKYKNKIAN